MIRCFSTAPKGETAFSVSGTGIDENKTLGTITVTVGNATTTVSTVEELLATANTSGVFKLANNIDIGDNRLNVSASHYILDLNGHTLSGSSSSFEVIKIEDGATVTVKNGIVKHSLYVAIRNEGQLTLDNCTVVSDGNAAFWNRATAVVKNCKFSSKNGFRCVSSTGNTTLSGNISLENGSFSNQGGTATALPGTYNFDVSSYVDTTLYDVTNDGTTWTVTAK